MSVGVICVGRRSTIIHFAKVMGAREQGQSSSAHPVAQEQERVHQEEGSEGN